MQTLFLSYILTSGISSSYLTKWWDSYSTTSSITKRTYPIPQTFDITSIVLLLIAHRLHKFILKEIITVIMKRKLYTPGRIQCYTIYSTRYRKRNIYMKAMKYYSLSQPQLWPEQCICEALIVKYIQCTCLLIHVYKKLHHQFQGFFYPLICFVIKQISYIYSLLNRPVV